MDTASDPSKDDVWGNETACANDSRITRPTTGGDTDPTASGASQGNTSYRTTTAFDGDDNWGERCELGKNSWNDGLASPQNPWGTFYNYNEGVRRATYFSERLPSNFPINANSWQVVMQMKQSGPSNNSGIGTPMLEMDVWAGSGGCARVSRRPARATHASSGRPPRGPASGPASPTTSPIPRTPMSGGSRYTST